MTETLLTDACMHPATELVKFRKPGYPYQKNYGPIWRCMTCDAFVGCHRGTTKPLGTPANAELRQARQRAHGAFDPIWKTGKMTRGKAYKRISGHFGRTIHIGEASLEDCQKIIDWSIAQQFEK